MILRGGEGGGEEEAPDACSPAFDTRSLFRLLTRLRWMRVVSGAGIKEPTLSFSFKFDLKTQFINILTISSSINEC